MLFANDQSWTISSVSFTGGFLDGQQFELAKGLNCVIGARGTGKTTVLELIRYAMGADPEGPAAKKRIESLVKGNLGGGRIQVELRTSEGIVYRVNRVAGEEPVVMDSRGEPTNISPSASGFLKICVFSQNEIETIADRSDSQLAMIDNFAADRISEINHEIQSVKSELESNAASITPLQKKRAIISDELTALPELEEKLKAFQAEDHEDAEEINAAHELKSLRDREMRAIRAADERLRNLYTSVKATIGQLSGPPFTEETIIGPNGELFASTQAEWQKSSSEIDEMLQHVLDRIKTQGKSLVETRQALELRHKKQEIDFQDMIAKHQQAQGKAAERTRLERRKNELAEKEQQRQQVEDELEKLQTTRTGLLRRLSELRDKRFETREEVAEQINKALSDSIRVTVSQFGSAVKYRELLETSLKKSQMQHGRAAKQIVSAMGPSELVQIIRKKEVTTLIDKTGLSSERASKVVSLLSDSPILFALEIVELIDLPTIELNDSGTYKETSELSTGQKCTTILPILLLDRESPLLIDQPEDNLDNRYVCETIVGSIHRVKQHRQLFFVTHNPNIPVLGDSDRVFVMSSDGRAARKIAEGSVDDCRDSIITLLEGGEQAFHERGRRYAK